MKRFAKLLLIFIQTLDRSGFEMDVNSFVFEWKNIFIIRIPLTWRHDSRACAESPEISCLSLRKYIVARLSAGCGTSAVREAIYRCTLSVVFRSVFGTSCVLLCFCFLSLFSQELTL